MAVLLKLFNTCLLIAAGRPEGTYFVLDCSSSIPVLRYQVPEYLDELSWLFVECTASGVTVSVYVVIMC